jgi:hypothetical protein
VKVYFTSGSNKLVFHHYGDTTYDIQSFTDRSITIKAPLGKTVIEFEFVSDDEFMAVYQSEWHTPPEIKGRFRRAVPRTPPPAATAGDSDDADLRGVFLGGWAKKQGDKDIDYNLEFTENTVTMTFKTTDGRLPKRLPSLKPVVCNYKSEGNRVSITDPKGHQEWFVVDFVSGREMVFALDRKDDTRTFIPDDGMVETLSGRWTRTSRPAGRLPASASITAAKLDVARIEEKLKIAEAKQQGIRKERNDVTSKLRDLGESADEVKGNPRARSLAESYATLTAEDEGLDSLLATIDTQLLKARSIVRKMELEQAGISDDEMKSLSRQLREIEARTDTTPRPITPLDADAALKAAFGNKKPSDKKR